MILFLILLRGRKPESLCPPARRPPVPAATSRAVFVQVGTGRCLLLQPPPQPSEAASQANMGSEREGPGKSTLPPKRTGRSSGSCPPSPGTGGERGRSERAGRCFQGCSRQVQGGHHGAGYFRTQPHRGRSPGCEEGCLQVLSLSCFRWGAFTKPEGVGSGTTTSLSAAVV